MPKSNRERILGRDYELESLGAMLEQALAGQSPCVVLTGEPGIGKTVLLRHTCSRASELGFTVAYGAATEFEQNVPFALAFDAFKELRGEVRSTVEQLGPERSRHLAAVLPAFHGSPADRGTRVPAERHLIHDAVRRLLEALAVERPLLLALDDVHWADDASIELVTHLIRRRPGGAVGLLIAHRRRHARRRLSAALAHATRTETLPQIELGPLDEPAAEALLGGHQSRAEVDRLYQESGGNPLYLEELTRAARSGASLQSGPLPRVISGAVAAEVAALNGSARDLLRAAAVVGDPFDLDLATSISEVTREGALAALDELAEAELTQPTDEPRAFRFRHPIVRRAVYESCPITFRVEAHRRSADELGALGSPPSTRAHHVERSAQPGDEAAISLLEAAGHADAFRAPSSAARWFAAALRLLPRSDTRRHDLIVAMTRALASAGRIAESRDALLEAVDMVPATDTLTRARMVALAASAERYLGVRGPAHDRIARSLSELGDTRSPASCTLRVELSANAWFAGRLDEMARHARRALREARTLGNRSLELDSGALLALAEYLRLRPAACERALDRAMDVALGNSELAEVVRAVVPLGRTALGLERYEDAERVLHLGLEVSRDTGQEFWFAPLLRSLSHVDARLGRLASALEHAEQGVETALLLENDQLLAAAFATLCWVQTLRGDLEHAIASGENACDLLARVPASPHWRAHCCLGAALIEAGDPAAGRAEILRGAGGGELSAIQPSSRVQWLETLCHVDLAMGNVSDAERWLERGRALVEAFPIPGRAAEVSRGRAAALLARGRPEECAATAIEAERVFRRQSRRIDAARAGILAGRALRLTGRPDEAGRILVTARDELRACGADAYSAEAERELQPLGPTEHAMLDALSPRQIEVAELVAHALTNRQIAARLSITDRTVERHLSRIYAALGLRSRAALAAAVERSRQGSASQRSIDPPPP